MPTRLMPAVSTKNLRRILAAATLLASTASIADTPLGWINNSFTSAYTLDTFSLELSGTALKVNETIDFLDFRQDLLSSSNRLVDNSGDLSGSEFELQFGLTSYLTAFASLRNQDLTLKLGPISRVTLSEIDEKLSTESREYGLRWNFFEAGHLGNDRPWHAASLELSRIESRSDDFTAKMQRIDYSANLVVTFDPPQQFQLENLEDEGWQARLLYSWPLTSSFTGSVWGGYSEMEASSGTGSEIDFRFLREAFQQSFHIEETQYRAGASINWQITPRLPLQLEYEFIKISSREITAVVSANSDFLPSFLRGSNLSGAESNHRLRGSLSYWLTPRLHIGINGEIYNNQFTGVMPHYNNPLSGSFSETPYGYAGLTIGYRI